jgi:hypothetical protein
MCLCHDENQKHRIVHEENKNAKPRRGGARPVWLDGRFIGYTGKTFREPKAGAKRRSHASVNRIEEKIKKCQKCRNPCNSGLNPIFQRRPRYQKVQAARLVSDGLKPGIRNYKSGIQLSWLARHYADEWLWLRLKTAGATGKTNNYRSHRPDAGMCDGSVSGCDGKCDGLGFRKCLIYM